MSVIEDVKNDHAKAEAERKARQRTCACGRNWWPSATEDAAGPCRVCRLPWWHPSKMDEDGRTMFAAAEGAYTKLPPSSAKPPVKLDAASYREGVVDTLMTIAKIAVPILLAVYAPGTLAPMPTKGASSTAAARRKGKRSAAKQSEAKQSDAKASASKEPEMSSTRRQARAIKPLIDLARHHGWRVDRTRSGHYRFTSPDKSQPALVTGGSPSDTKARLNFISELRAAGLPVPH